MPGRVVISVALDSDALVIGAGPAGTATAILLRRAGWRVLLVEKLAFPRQKVCGECLSAASLGLLDELGVGAAVSARVGPELTRVGWMAAASPLVADLPECRMGTHRYGRALGRDLLDLELIEHARQLGVRVLQPAKVLSVQGTPGNFTCAIRDTEIRRVVRPWEGPTHRTAVIIDAHGSWSAAPDGAGAATRLPPRGADLFGFKASFLNSSLPAGTLPVLAFTGGYGGMVLAEDGRVTVAGCLRRDVLQATRARLGGISAGAAFEQHLRRFCPGLQAALDGARRMGPWLSVGPLRFGVRVGDPSAPLRVGNAAGESHPLIGEGMTMALESAFLLTRSLIGHAGGKMDANRWSEVHRRYAVAWKAAFSSRRRVAAAYARVIMQPALQSAAQATLRRWPRLLGHAAHWAGKDVVYRQRIGLDVAP